MTITSSAVLKARIYKEDSTWSALKQVEFYSPDDDLSKLKVTELNYHPQDIILGSDTTEGKSFEFIEFKNTSDNAAVNLSGLVLDSAVYYKFPDNTLLAPGNFYVIATKPSCFYEMYGRIPSGNCENFFDNSGDYVLLSDAAGREILSFTYDDHLPWPEEPDGDGYTLTSVERDPAGNPNDYHYWTLSSTINGSPFSDDYQFSVIEPVAQSTLGNSYLVYPNPSSGHLVIQANTQGAAFSNRSTVTLYALNGTLHYKGNLSDNAIIDLGVMGLQPGMYILKIENAVEILIEKIIYQP